LAYRGAVPLPGPTLRLLPASALVTALVVGAFVACGDTGAGPAGGGGQDASSGQDAPPNGDVDARADAPSEAAAADAGGDAGPDAGWTLGPPFATDPPPFAATPHPLAPTAFWGQLKAPYPTNAEWENLALYAGTQPFNMLPYVVTAQDGGFDVSVPTRTTTTYSVNLNVQHDLAFTTTEGANGRVLVDYDAFGATMRWSSGAAKTMTASFVHGMAMATAVYAGLTPRFTSPHQIAAVNGAQASPVTADRFVLTFDDATTWVLYTSSPITASWGAAGPFVATTPFTGQVSAARVGGDPGALAVLDAHRSAYATGGDLAASVTGDTGQLTFAWKKAGTGPLLMMAMPHHLDVLGAPKTTTQALRSIGGTMSAVEGDAWSLNLPLPAIRWTAPTPIDPAHLAEVKAALVADTASASTSAPDPYFFGKQVARLGRLALIADEVGDTASASSLRATMRLALEPWLAGTNTDALRYDTTWGGICSARGLANPNDDNGQGYYNDHHFHYGYFLYAAAALGKGDGPWLASRRPALTALARDIANPSKADTQFTPFRMMDWFTGHSWATGLFLFGDTHNQESSSEAVNAWYGLYLYGLALGDANLTNVGRLLLASEIRSTQKYFHIKSSDTIYDAPFTARKTVGRVDSLAAVYDTFFGSNEEYIHGIQMLPFTPITEALLDAPWVTEEHPYIASKLTAGTDQGWRGFIVLDHAVIDHAAAWTEVTALTGFDNGNSRTNSLHWVATRPR
jgi:endo-1,3(4)-beta-glucanase